jgi:thiamine pyrophosphate-dependent acetolactate synthase large subunit-like protein
MNIQAKKLELVDLILKTEEVSLLEKVSKILKQEKEEDWWDELPDSVKESIEIGLEQAEKGETIPHKNVLNEIKAKYGLK